MERGELMLRLKQSSEGHGPIQAAGKWRVMRSSSSKHPCGLNHGGGGVQLEMTSNVPLCGAEDDCPALSGACGSC